jgi:hypothetical protein
VRSRAAAAGSAAILAVAAVSEAILVVVASAVILVAAVSAAILAVGSAIILLAGSAIVLVALVLPVGISAEGLAMVLGFTDLATSPYYGGYDGCYVFTPDAYSWACY